MLFNRIAPIVAGGLMFAAGCAEDQGRQGTGEIPSNGTAMTAGSQRASTDTLPDAVSASFHNEYPAASVTNIVQSSAENGAPIYRITYIAAGVPGSVTYFASGKHLPTLGSPDNAPPSSRTPVDGNNQSDRVTPTPSDRTIPTTPAPTDPATTTDQPKPQTPPAEKP